MNKKTIRYLKVAAVTISIPAIGILCFYLWFGYVAYPKIIEQERIDRIETLHRRIPKITGTDRAHGENRQHQR